MPRSTICCWTELETTRANSAVSFVLVCVSVFEWQNEDTRGLNSKIRKKSRKQEKLPKHFVFLHFVFCQLHAMQCVLLQDHSETRDMGITLLSKTENNKKRIKSDKTSEKKYEKQQKINKKIVLSSFSNFSKCYRKTRCLFLSINTINQLGITPARRKEGIIRIMDPEVFFEKGYLAYCYCYMSLFSFSQDFEFSDVVTRDWDRGCRVLFLLTFSCSSLVPSLHVGNGSVLSDSLI
jgi:hypothetical protein